MFVAVSLVASANGTAVLVVVSEAAMVAVRW